MNGPFSLPGAGPIQRFEQREALGFLPRGWIDGFILSNDTTDATNDLAIAAGAARSTVNIVDGTASTLTRDQIDLEIPVSIIKQLDVAFAHENYDPEGFSGGDRSGGRSSSAISNTSWHINVVGGGGLQTDVFFHDSATQANVLAEMQKIGGYTAYRNIGSLNRASGAWQLFHQYNDEFWLDSPVGDFSAASGVTTAVTRTLTSVPTGIKVQAILEAQLVAATAGAGFSYFSSLDSVDGAAAATNATVIASSNSGNGYTAIVRLWTDTSAQIRTRTSITGGGDVTRGTTLGWVHPRGKNS